MWLESKLLDSLLNDIDQWKEAFNDDKHYFLWFEIMFVAKVHSNAGINKIEAINLS